MAEPTREELAARCEGLQAALEEKAARVERLEGALRTIRGPEDRGPWIMVYREAGGGYEGLQAIATVALDG
jgi:hypothetical protein